VACKKSSATRGIYVFQFLVVAVVAYIFSNWAEDWLKNVPVFKECPEGNTCYGALAVYRITFGLAVSCALTCKYVCFSLTRICISPVLRIVYYRRLKWNRLEGSSTRWMVANKVFSSSWCYHCRILHTQ